MKKSLYIVLALGLATSAYGQCPGDPTGGNPTTRDAILTLGQTIPATASDAMQRMASALQRTGRSVVVMDNNGPSDHKAWIDGDAWTWRSSDPKRCPTITWSPYVQSAYDGSGFSACGIPTSAHLDCPAWFTTVVPPPVTPPSTDTTTEDARITALQDQINFLRELVDQLTPRVTKLESTSITSRVIPTRCVAVLKVGSTKVPISCTLQ